MSKTAIAQSLLAACFFALVAAVSFGAAPKFDGANHAQASDVERLCCLYTIF